MMNCGMEVQFVIWGFIPDRVSREERGRQMSLFDNTDYEKMEKMDQAVDAIRKKFGKNAIMRASFLDNKKVEHMTGGHPDGRQVDLKTLREKKHE